jgi:hypothetical protein
MSLLQSRTHASQQNDDLPAESTVIPAQAGIKNIPDLEERIPDKNTRE